MSIHTIALIGNPNSGKTSLFNVLTGTRQRTGNWPGVTVERKEGRYQYRGERYRVIDLPGTYSLDPEDTSADERIARDFLLSHQADVIINIVDTTQLERALYLSLQLLETGVPQILALNMMDMAKSHGMEVDIQALSEILGIPVVPLVVKQAGGIETLKETVARQAKHPTHPNPVVSYPPQLEEAATELENELAPLFPELPPRWLALHLLAGHPLPLALSEKAKQRIALITDLPEDSDLLIADARYRQAQNIGQKVLRRADPGRTTPSDRIDAIVLNRWLGVPVFLLAMYWMFTFTINFGGAFVDFFDQASGALFVDGFKSFLQTAGAPPWIQIFLAEGIGGGFQVVSTFIPIIGFLYLFLTFLEDSGYMARAAFIMDRLMSGLGLPGKAFVPLIVGFGCNVPSIMAARTLEGERERILTVMMAPFMSCGARLAVYALFAAAFFPHGGQNVVFALYVIGILAAMLTAFLLKTTLLPGEPEALLMELPTYQLPSLRNLLLHSWLRLKGFVTDAGKYIVFMVMVINVFNAWSTDGRFGDVEPDHSMLSAAARAITPVFEPLGIHQDNWPATVGVMTGVLAKEVVVGALDTLYSRLDQDGGSSKEKKFELFTSLKEALATIPTNLQDAVDNLGDPLGLGILDANSNPAQAAAAQQVHGATFGAMVRHFDGRHGAFAYLLFILLYAPCVAATATIRRETGNGWMFFALAWTTGLAYGCASFYYQASTFAHHPLQSSAWMTSIAVVLAAFWLLLKMRGRHPAPTLPASGNRGGPDLIHRSCCK